VRLFHLHLMCNEKFGGGVQVKEHSDTSFSAGSLGAARRAAGTVQHAVDR
jgi:hypothetical protein